MIFTLIHIADQRIWRNLHNWQKFYTPAVSDVSDKFHLWLSATKFMALGHQKENRINFFPSENDLPFPFSTSENRINFFPSKNDLPFPFFHKTSKVNLYEKLHWKLNQLHSTVHFSISWMATLILTIEKN